MADQSLTDILANLVRANAKNGPLPTLPQVSGLSQAILSQIPVQNPYKSGAVQNAADVRGPSFVNRILDILSRPEYAILNHAQKAYERSADQGTGPLGALNEGLSVQGVKDLWAGLSGKEKVTGKDILEKDHIGEDLPGPAKAALAFGIDIAADPLTYIDGGGIPGKVLKLGKGAEKSTQALADLEKGTAETAQGLTADIAKNAAEQSKKLEIEVPKTGEPAPPIGSPPRTFVAGPGVPGVTDELGKLIEEGKVRPNLGADLEEPTLKLDLRQSSPMRALPSGIKPELESVKNIKLLNRQIEATRSPVIKNILRSQVTKLSAGVKPADVLDAAKVSPPMFPALTISERWISAAKYAAQSFLKTNRLKDINHVGQSNLYNKVLNAASKVRKDRRNFTVLQMLRIAEEQVLDAGRHLTDAEGASVRLSDVANMMGGAKALSPKLVDDFRRARPSTAVENVRAFMAPQTASQILDPVMQTAKKLEPSVAALPPSQTVRVGSQISKELAKIAQGAGASQHEAGVAKAFIDDLFNPARDKLYSQVHQVARGLVRQTATGKIDPQALSHVSKAVYDSLGANPKVLGRELNQSKVVEGIMTKFATWWGAKDIRPFAREYIDTARNVASAFGETMRPLVTSTTATQRKIAWSVAQGKQLAGSIQEQGLADEFKHLTEHLMGTHGITDNAEAVVLRSGTIKDELNAVLPKAMQFIDKKGEDELGRAFDYSHGNWMDSWKEWKTSEPAETLYQLTRGLQLVTRKNAMWDDAAIRWGLPTKMAEYQHEASNVARLKGTYFPQQIATQLNNLQAQLERDVFKSPNKAIGLFDKVQRIWKTGVTVYSPSHHIRNLNGDVYLASLDGVTSARPYAIAAKVLHAFPTRYKDLESVFKIMDPKLRETALRARPGNVVLTTARGEKVTAEQLYQAAESQGIFPRVMNIEELGGEGADAFGSFGAKFKPFNGKVYDAATRASELREHWVRLAHFTDVLTKSKQPLKIAIETAGRRVKKFHPDGTDLTGFEQNVLRRVIPFYSWMRKATPLVIEGVLMHPAISLAFPKAMSDLQEATGIESQGPGNPFPMDQIFPEWLKEKGIGPVLGPESGLGRQDDWRGHAPGDTIINPSTPLLDQLQQLGNPSQTILSGLTPAARIPIELLTGNTSLGIPIANQEGGVPGYLANQIPAVGIGTRITGMTRSNEPYNPEQLINWLTALGITGTGPYQAQGQTEIRQALTDMANKNRGSYR
jgi:hypothetical protein